MVFSFNIELIEKISFVSLFKIKDWIKLMSDVKDATIVKKIIILEITIIFIDIENISLEARDVT